MLLSCPHCNYSKEIPPGHLPADAVRATCPRCRRSFDLHREQPSGPSAATQSLGDGDVQQRPEQTDRSTGDRSVDIDALPKAGFWIRVVATLIDGMLIFTLQFVLGFLLAIAGFAATSGAGEEVSGLLVLFSYAISFAYSIIFTGHCGQTPGKMAVRIKVIRCDGDDIGYGRAAFREVVGKFISGIILGIGYLMVAFDEQKQGLHDRMADTYVIKL